MKIHRKPMEIGWMKYRPKPRKVVEVLLRRFCTKCWRIRGLGRSFKLLKNRCGRCPVFESITSIDPRLKRIKVELEELKKRGAVGNV